jgi:hypothetical protein
VIALLPLPAHRQSAPTWSFAFSESDRPGALLDLRSLNEKVSGETGFVRLSPDGRSFVRGDGQPIRFWPVCSYGYRLKPDEMAANARFLAKMGVNMVRIHASVSPKGPGKSLADYDADEIDRIQRYVAAIKKEGIYATISPYWANGGHSGAAASWGLGYGDGEDIWGLLFFDERLQKAYKGWVKHLYLDPNRYTGVPLGKDPTVAIAQVQNEDSLLFWTFQNIKPAEKSILSKKFGQWLTQKYGSLPAARSHWIGADAKGDGWPDGAPAMLDTWVLTQPQTGGMKTRSDDQMAFLIDTQKAFYADMIQFYRHDLGYKGLTNASNWITADPVRQNDAERYTYTPADVIAVNHYYAPTHQGPNSGWRIDEGDTFADTSALLDPRALPTNVVNVVGHPTIVTESGWVHPLGYQAEGPILTAAYESLSGVAGLYWFELGAKEYAENPTFDFVTTPDGSHPLSKWEDSVPQILGQFPAAAVMYREGYLKQGFPVVREVRSRAQLDERDIPVIAEDPSFDPNHHGEDSRAGAAEATGANPLSFLVGPVEVQYGGDPTKTQVSDVSSYVDAVHRRVKSDTGELSLDFGKGLLTIDSPKAQSVVGFLQKSGGKFSLSSLTVESENDYGAISAVSLDGLPLSNSKRILVQIGTVVRPTGWKQVPTTMKSQDGKSSFEGWKVENTGKMPWQVVSTLANLTIKNSGLTKATALDPNGFSQGSVPVTRSGGTLKLELPANAMYVVLE